MHARVITFALLAACGHERGPDRVRSSLFTEVPLATEPGLSGLAVDRAGALWTIAERARTAYRITLDVALHPTLETFAIDGTPDGFDLESIAVLGDDVLAIGTEGHAAGSATILRAERRGDRLTVTSTISIPEETVGLPLAENHGAEGVCGSDATIIAAIETAGEDRGRRWAPVVRIVDGVVRGTYRVWLTTRTGRISGLDCAIDPDGTVHAWAIERHFGETALLAFTLRPDLREPITPTVLMELGSSLDGHTNLEGIGRLPDGRLVAVVDNQWKQLEGSSRLLVFRPAN